MLQTEDFQAQTSAILEEGNEETATPIQRSRGGRSGLRLGLVFIALSAMGVVGLKYTGTYPFNRPVTPMQAMIAVQDRLMAAFTARALGEKPDFKAVIEAVVKEEGTKDPTAMTMHVKMQAGQTATNWPTGILTFEAQPGKQNKLKNQLERVKKAIVDMQCQDAQDDDQVEGCKKIGQLVQIKKGQQSVHFGKGEFVFLIVKAPKDAPEQQADKDVAEAFKEHNARFLVEANFGRTIEDMFDNKDMNMIKLLNGFHMRVATDFASSAFDAVSDMAGPDAKSTMEIMKGFAKFKTRQEILYKSDDDLEGAFDDIPSFEAEMRAFKKEMKRGPQKIIKPLSNLQNNAKGLKGIVLSGLPTKMEVVVEFTNFHPSKLLGAVLD